MLSGADRRGGGAGEWVLAARALNDLVQGVPPDLAGRARRDARADAGRRRAGRLRVAGGRRVLPGQGPSRRSARAICTAAIHALERAATATAGTCAAAGGPTTTPSSWPGSTSRTASSTRSTRSSTTSAALPGVTGMVIPALAFHVACRRGDLEAAERWLDEVFRGARRPAVAQRITGARPDVRRDHGRVCRASGSIAMGKEMLDDDVWDEYRRSSTRRSHEVHGDHDRALAATEVVCDRRDPAPRRGTAHVGAARCLLARGPARRGGGPVDEAATVLAAVAWLAGGPARRGPRPARARAPPTASGRVTGPLR